MAPTTSKQKILAIIPARGGAKRLPCKNIKPLLGRPLIVYTIDSALQSEHIDRVVVSTDDDEITKISKGAGAEVVKRPQELAGDTTNVQLAIEQVLSSLKEKEKYEPDAVVLLQPTSPLRTTAHIDEAIDQFLKEGHDSLLSVSLFKAFIWKENSGAYQPINYDIDKRIMTQDKKPEYREQGAIYITKYATLVNNHNVLGGKIGLYVMPEDVSIDIDNELDFYLCEQLLKRKSA